MKIKFMCGDSILAQIESRVIPRIGETITLNGIQFDVKNVTYVLELVGRSTNYDINRVLVEVG